MMYAILFKRFQNRFVGVKSNNLEKKKDILQSLLDMGVKM